MKFPYTVEKNCLTSKITITVTVKEIIKDHIVFEYTIKTPSRNKTYTEMIDAKSAINNKGLEETIQYLIDSLARTISEEECQVKLSDILKLDAKEIVFSHKLGEDPKFIITTKKGEKFEVDAKVLSGKEQRTLFKFLKKFFKDKVICEPENPEDVCEKIMIIFTPKNKSYY